MGDATAPLSPYWLPGYWAPGVGRVLQCMRCTNAQFTALQCLPWGCEGHLDHEADWHEATTSLTQTCPLAIV